MALPSSLKNERINKWLIVELENAGKVNGGVGSFCLISDSELINAPKEDIHTGKTVAVQRGKSVRKGSVVIVSEDRKFLDTELKHLQNISKRSSTEPSVKADTRKQKSSKASESASDEDFSRSESDWNPEGNGSSESENEPRATNKRKYSSIKTEHYVTNSNSKPKVPKLKADPVLTKNVIRDQYSQRLMSTTRRLSEHLNIRQSPSFRYNSTYNLSNITVDFQELPIDIGPKSHQRVPMNQATPQRPIPPMTFDQQTQTPNGGCESITRLKTNYAAIKQHLMRACSSMQDMKMHMNFLEMVLNDLNSYVNINGEDMEMIDEVFQQPQVPNGLTPASSHAGSNEAPPDDMPIHNDVPRDISLRQQNFHQRLARKTVGSIKQENYQAPPGTYEDQLAVYNFSEPEADLNDMVAIGCGKTLIPKHVYNQIDWNSHTIATRKLLMAVFPRRILATHSLTGKSSPAFTDRPAKMSLDQKKVSDIVTTVSQRCRVRESLVRSAITTKCADENKMFRMRASKHKKHKKNKIKVVNRDSDDSNQENLLPPPDNKGAGPSA